jgi:glutaredoxin
VEIVLVSKPGCPRCLLAKDKLHRMNLPYRMGNLGDIGPVEDTDFPVFLIDGERYSYPAAMARLKEVLRG